MAEDDDSNPDRHGVHSGRLAPDESRLGGFGSVKRSAALIQERNLVLSRRSYANRVRLALLLVCLISLGAPAAARPGDHPKLDQILNERAHENGHSRVIVRMNPGWDASSDMKKLGGKLGRVLRSIDGRVAELPNGQLKRLADHPGVLSIHYDRPTGGEMNRAAVTVGARWVQWLMGYDGAGIGVAVIDSGITSWHDDLTYSGSSPQVKRANGQRVAAFVDFVNGRTSTYDDHGHGTHVAGIIAGNGRLSWGARAGIAPAAHLVSLKVLDYQARGVISDVIAALEFAIANRAAYNIRIINLSVGAAVTESYRTDPITLAAKRAVDAGIVVVTAAGNLGRNAAGQTQYGAITAPGNAPWVLTVGAYSHEGTLWRFDDKVAGYSSRGPTAHDFGAKPDLLAPGTGIVSLSDPTSTLYATKSDQLLSGSVLTSYKPYLSLSGTSMAAPVVTGAVALMLQANPSLTPNLVKAILQYTSQAYDYDALTQGAGFLNVEGAVQLARFYGTATSGSTLYAPSTWSKKIIWGNQQLAGGQLLPNANAWRLDTTWGAALAFNGENIVWGTLCGSSCENIVWGTFGLLENIVWGTLLDGSGENIVWGTFFDAMGENIVWGTLSFAENIVWGTDCGGADCENVVWGSHVLSFQGENIVWGTAEGLENIVWGSGLLENIVWGTASESDNVTWGNSGEDTPLFDDPAAQPVSYDGTVFETLFGSASQESSSTTATAPATSSTTTTTTTSTSVTSSVTGILGGGL
jgi:serine protease AprX